MENEGNKIKKTVDCENRLEARIRGQNRDLKGGRYSLGFSRAFPIFGRTPQPLYVVVPTLFSAYEVFLRNV